MCLHRDREQTLGLSVCLSVFTPYILYFLIPSYQLSSPVFSRILTSTENPFRFTLLSSLLLFNSFLFVIHSFLSSCPLPPPLRPSCVSWSVLCTHSAPCGSSLVCCRCLDSAETIRFVLNAASHWAPTLIGVSTQAGFHLPAQM